jgi:hypothetical protein
MRFQDKAVFLKQYWRIGAADLLRSRNTAREYAEAVFI